MPAPDPERQVQFLFNVQRLISDGSFVATYKFALLLALADLAVERGDDTTESLPLDTLDLAEKFVDCTGGRSSRGSMAPKARPAASPRPRARTPP